jgi:catechol 2,3-dioxygenase-like lactoylglutathione lyase family enzyme
MAERKKSQVVGFNHVALEVGDIEEALAFYGEFLAFELRSQSENMAFIDLGDQFLALSKGRRQAPDDNRHFGLVVEDKAVVARTLEEMGVEIISDRFLDFLDPWGNRIEIIGYQNIQFTKAPHILRAMGLARLRKSESALKELADRGMAPG